MFFIKLKEEEIVLSISVFQIGSNIEIKYILRRFSYKNSYLSKLY